MQGAGTCFNAPAGEAVDTEKRRALAPPPERLSLRAVGAIADQCG